MANNWLTVLMIVVSHCGALSHGATALNKCRADALDCVKRGIAVAPQAPAQDVVNACLADNKAWQKVVAANQSAKPDAIAQEIKKAESPKTENVKK